MLRFLLKCFKLCDACLLLSPSDRIEHLNPSRFDFFPRLRFHFIADGQKMPYSTLELLPTAGISLWDGELSRKIIDIANKTYRNKTTHMATNDIWSHQTYVLLQNFHSIFIPGSSLSAKSHHRRGASKWRHNITKWRTSTICKRMTTRKLCSFIQSKIFTAEIKFLNSPFDLPSQLATQFVKILDRFFARDFKKINHFYKYKLTR